MLPYIKGKRGIRCWVRRSIPIRCARVSVVFTISACVRAAR